MWCIVTNAELLVLLVFFIVLGVKPVLPWCSGIPCVAIYLCLLPFLSYFHAICAVVVCFGT